MSFEMDEEILQDFLVEAGEILELLSEQLVDLEKSPEDKDLLNAIFRGFHTVKGGAGFLALTPLVDTCHGAENVFDTLRNGGRKLTSEVMDVILQALDAVNEQFSCVQEGNEIPLAEPALLEALHKYSKPALEDENEDNNQEIQNQEDIKDQSSKDTELTKSQEVSSSNNVDEITDDEFEKLLDELHGKNKFSSDVAEKNIQSDDAKSDDEITDDEFEKLLDELHGKGVSPSSDSSLKEIASEVNKDDSTNLSSTEDKTTSARVEKTEEKKSISSQVEQTVRVNTSTLDSIMNMVGELVLVRNRLMSIGAESDDEKLMKVVTNLDVVTADLQGAVMQTRMQPIKKVFGRFPRVVRDLARSLKKDIVLEMKGEETDLDKNLVEALADPMVHLVRNSVDHGIEMPDVREQIGKSSVGTITLSASQEGDHILLTIEDDGGGMDANKLRQIAVNRGLMDADAAGRLSDSEAFNLIFAPGFSTKTEISDISGRGVGMDVVKTAINQLNGTIAIDSEMGKGTTISIKVPLTLAILPTLMVGVGGSPFALPLSNVNEIISLDLTKTNTVDGQLTLIVRDKAIPLFYLQDWLGAKEVSDKDTGHVVIVQLGHQSVAFVVDFLIGQEEVVIKPLDEMLQGTPGMAGATITSDGHIALILDVPNLLKKYAVK